MNPKVIFVFGFYFSQGHSSHLDIKNCFISVQNNPGSSLQLEALNLGDNYYGGGSVYIAADKLQDLLLRISYNWILPT